MTKKLTAHPYAQACVFIHDNGMVTLVSYTTPVAQIDEEGWLVINGLYSMTTRRHIGAFVQEYAGIPDQTAKMICENRQRFNIHTGEIEDWA